MSKAGPSTGSSLADRVVKATVAIAVAHMMAKVFGIVQARVIGHYYGFGIETDAFVLAFEGLIWTLFLIGEESLGPAFLPCFMQARDKESEEAAWRYSSTLLNLQILLLVGVTALLMLFPNQAIELFSRFKGKEVDAQGLSRTALAAGFLAKMAPALVGLSIGSLTYMILNGYKVFFWPAFADAALKFALAGGILFGRKLGLTNDALVVGVLAGGATKILVHLLALSPKLRLWRPRIILGDPNVRRFLLLVAPLLAGIVFAKVRDYFNYYYVISSLEEGLLSVNSFGRKIYNAIGFLVPYPLSIAFFPFFCEMVDRDDQKSLGQALTRASRMLLLMFLPLTAVLSIVSIPLAQALFQTGKVSGADAALAGQVSICYTAVLPFYALECIFMQAYFSTRRMWSVTLIGVVFSSLSMGISTLGVLVYKMDGVHAVMLVALGYSVSRALKLFVLIGILKWQGLPVLPIRPTLVFLSRALLVMLLCGSASYGVLQGVERFLPSERASAKAAEATAGAPKGEDSGRDGKARVSGKKALIRAMPKLVLPGLAALILFYPACKLLRLRELDEIIAFAREKVRRKKGGGPPPAAESP